MEAEQHQRGRIQQRPAGPHGGQLRVAVAEQVGDTAAVQDSPPLLRGVQVRVAVEVEHAHLTAGPFLPPEPGHGAQHQRAVTAEQNRNTAVGPRGRDGISDPADHIQDGRQIPGAGGCRAGGEMAHRQVARVECRDDSSCQRAGQASGPQPRRAPLDARRMCPGATGHPNQTSSVNPLAP